MTISVEDFMAGHVDPGRFDHAAHVEVAWRFIDRFGAAEGAQKFREQLFRLTIELGAPDKFHETITCFFLEQIAARQQHGDTWPCFRDRNEDLLNGRRLLERYYSPDTLKSDEARSRYLPPDRERQTDAPAAATSGIR